MNVSKKRQDEERVVRSMIELYCRKKHKSRGKLCEECKELAEYAALRTQKCPFMETKTFCSACKVHCYAPEQKEKIKEVMRFSGPWMLCYHPVLAIKHAFVTMKNVKSQKKRLKASDDNERDRRERFKHRKEDETCFTRD